MAQITYAPGTPGNVFNNVALAATKNAAALVDFSTPVGSAIACKMITGSTAPTVQTTFSAYRITGSAASGVTTVATTAASGATTLTVASSTVAAMIGKGEKVAIISASTEQGELVTVNSVSGATLTLATGTENAYAVGDKVFFIEQVAYGGSIAPGLSWSNNSTYGGGIYPTPGWMYIFVATNGDSAQGVTVFATSDTDPSFG